MHSFGSSQTDLHQYLDDAERFAAPSPDSSGDLVYSLAASMAGCVGSYDIREQFRPFLRRGGSGEAGGGRRSR